MNKKFWFLVKQSLLKKIKTKTFIIVNIILLIVFLSLLNIDKIVMSFGGKFDKQNNIMVLDNTNIIYDEFKTNITDQKTIIDTGLKYKVTRVYNEEEAKKKITKDEEMLIIINSDEENIMDVKLITYGYIDKNLYQIIYQTLNKIEKQKTIESLNISKETLDKINSNLAIKREYIEKDKNQNEESMKLIMSVLTPVIILPFFMLITLVVQMIGAEINEEKSTRSMEIIISNVSAKSHFFSKVLSANLFVLIQCILLLIYSSIGVLIRGGSKLDINSIRNMGDIKEVATSIQNLGILNNVATYIPFVLILMLITLFGYSLLAGILASMTTNMEDFQQLQTPIMVISLAGFYLALMSSMFEGSLFIRIISYIPFISAILSPSLLLSGVIGIKDMILSILLMIVVVYFLIKYGLRIYKEGILNYSSNKLWKKMLKALKK